MQCINRGHWIISRTTARGTTTYFFTIAVLKFTQSWLASIDRGEVYQHLPPIPPEVHDFVYPASDEEIRKVTQGFDFLRLVATVTTVPQDELAAASIREAYKSKRRRIFFSVLKQVKHFHIFSKTISIAW